MKKALCAQFEVYTGGTLLLYLFYPHDLTQCPSIENAALPFHQRPLDPSSWHQYGPGHERPPNNRCPSSYLKTFTHIKVVPGNEEANEKHH